MAKKKENGSDKYIVPKHMIGKVCYTRVGPIELKEDLSPDQKAFLVSQGVKLEVNEEAEIEEAKE